MTTTLARRTDPSTSHEAAQSVPVSSLRADCLAAIQKAPMGLTSEEIAHVTGRALVAVSPRLRPMANDGLIYAGGKRKNASGCLAIVWFAAHTQLTLF